MQYQYNYKCGLNPTHNAYNTGIHSATDSNDQNTSHLHCVKMRLRSGLFPDTSGELSALPRSANWIWGKGLEKREMERTRVGKGTEREKRQEKRRAKKRGGRKGWRRAPYISRAWRPLQGTLRFSHFSSGIMSVPVTLSCNRHLHAGEVSIQYTTCTK